MERVCRNCSEKFLIDKNDLGFLANLTAQFPYLEIPIPPPTLCPLCRLNRRLAFRNMNQISWGEEHDTKERIFTFYPGGAPFPLIKNEKWWSGDYEVKELEAFDPNRSFFEQFLSLRNQIPHPALNVNNAENSDYCNNANDLRNCYMVFGAGRSEDSAYCENIASVVNCLDCLQTFNSELCVDCARCSDCYNLQSSNLCFHSSDSFFLHNCRSCKNCIGCVNLQQREYCIFNEQKTKKEYEEFLNENDLSKFSVRELIYKKFLELIRAAVHPNVLLRQVEDCSGNIIAECKNVTDSFFIRDSENIRYCYSVGNKVNNSMDVSYWGDGVELCYEAVVTGKSSSRIVLSFNCWGGNDSLIYCELCVNCQNCFGCVGLQRKEYCIFNKQYSKEAYFKEVNRIVAQMSKQREWGEFFPIHFTPHAYNTSVAHRYFPMNEDDALNLGLNWFEDKSLNNMPAIDASSLPEAIPSTDESIVVRSKFSGKLFKITGSDIARYRSFNMPLPRLSFLERMDQHMQWLGGLKPIPRKCARTGGDLLSYFEESLYPNVIDYEIFNQEYSS